MRPHEALNGKTPAEESGVVIEGKDKWRTIMENAMQRNTTNIYYVTLKVIS
jgi:hypothetical protein